MTVAQKNDVFINDQGIIEINVIGDQTHDSVMEMGERVRDCLHELDRRNKPAVILDDITKMGATDIPARQAVKRLSRTLPFKKAAMIGGPSLAMRYGTNLLLQAIGMGSKIKYFEDRDKAIEWLTTSFK